MNHQDWTEIILKNPNVKKLTQEKEKPSTHFEVTKQQKIDKETENLSHEKVGLDVGKKIQNLRIAKGFKTQKQLANALNIKDDLIKQYETGKAIPDNQIMQKLKKVLGKF